MLPFPAVRRLFAVPEEPVFTAVLHDAWRQYWRRPVAVVLVVAISLAEIPLYRAGEALALAFFLPVLVVSVLLELFLIAYLAGGLAATPPPVADAVAAMRRSFAPGVRALLLKGLYTIPAIVLGMLMFGARDTGPLPASEQTKFFMGLAPLFGFAWAFLAVLNQRIVLDRESRVLRAAAVSHRVAAANFPICLLIALMDAISLVAFSIPGDLAGVAIVTLVLALVEPFRIAMSNALFQRTRPLHTAGPETRTRDRNRWPD